MSNFTIQYRIGEGKKLRKLTITNVADKQEASIKFLQQAPDNSYIVYIEESKEPRRGNLVQRKMSIQNSFDQFILDTLHEKNLTNEDLIKHMSMTRKTWGILRRHPENLYLYDLMLMSELLDIDIDQLIKETTKVIMENKDNHELAPARFRSKK